MKSKLFFWTEWKLEDQVFFWFLLVVSLAMGAYTLYAEQFGFDVTIPIYTDYYQKSFPTVFHRFYTFWNESVLEVKSFLLTQKYVAGSVQVPFEEVVIPSIGLLIGGSLIMAAMSLWKGFYYFGGLVLWSILMFTSQLGSLDVDNPITNYWALAVLALPLLLSVAVRFTRLANLPFYRIAIAYFILFYILLDIVPGELGITFNSVAVISRLSGVLFAILFVFIILVAFDIPAIFYVLITNSKSVFEKKGTLINLIIFSVLYFGNLFVYVLQANYGGAGKFALASPLILFLVSGIVGIYIFRKKAEVFKGVMDYYQSGRWFYWGMLIFSWSGLGYFYITANDSLTTLTEELVVFSSIGFGLLFVIYLIFNFVEVFDKYQEVHKVMFKPVRLPLAFVFALGIGVLFVYNSAYRSYPRAMLNGGLALAKGLGAISVGQFDVAEFYYDIAANEDFKGAHAPIVYAEILLAGEQNEKAERILFESFDFRPKEQNYFALVKLLEAQRREQGQKIILQDAIKKIPNCFRAANNLALSYLEEGKADSATYFFNMARAATSPKAELEANVLAFYALSGNTERSLINENAFPDDLAYQNNRIAIANKANLTISNFPKFDYKSDSTLNLLNFSYVYNYALNKGLGSDTTAIAMVNHYTQFPNDANMMHELRIIRSVAKFKEGYRLKALENLDNLSADSDAKQAALTEGKMLVALGEYEKAIEKLEPFAIDDAQNTRWLFIHALGASGRIAEMRSLILVALRATENATEREKLESILSAIDFKPTDEFSSLTEMSKLALLYYRGREFSAARKQQLASSFSQVEFKKHVGAALVKNFNSEESIQDPALVYNWISGLTTDLAKEEASLEVANSKLNKDDQLKLLSKVGFSGSEQRYWSLLGTVQKKGSDSYWLLQYYPFSKVALEAGVEGLNANQQGDVAYDALLAHYHFVPNQPWAQALYIKQCYKLNLRSFATEALERYRGMVSAKEYEAFKAEIGAN